MDEDKVARISHHVEQILGLLGLSAAADPELGQTPRRVAEFYLELFGNTHDDSQPEVTEIERTSESGEMVVIRDLPFYSLCVHHFLPFHGRAHIAYVPGRKIVGISSVGRLLDHYARRPQLQERLTEQVAEALYRALEAEGVMIVLETQQLCMEMRGARKSGQIITTATRGCFHEKPWREEFLSRL